MDIREVKALTGMGLMEITGGMKRAGTDDPLVGAGYMLTAGRALVVRGDRHAYNLRGAEDFRRRLMQKYDELETCPYCALRTGKPEGTVHGSGDFSVTTYRCLYCGTNWSD